MLPSLGALKSLGSGLYNMGRGALFMGASKGATTGGKIMNGVGHAAPLAPVVAGSFKATSQQPGFQPQSTVKTSVSREWINQRVQNAVDGGASPERLQGFIARNDARAQQLNDQLLTTIQQGGAVDPRQASAAGKRLAAYTAGTFATALAGRYQYETPGMSASFNGNGYSYPSSQHALHVPEKLNTSPKAPIPSPASNNLRRYWPLALGGALAASAYGLYRHNRNSPSEQEAEPKQAELHPLIERVLRAKLASDWHRPVNALSYAAFAAPYLSQTVHDNHKLTTALNAAGLLGLGATSADSLAKGDGLAGYDLAGLGLMGAGLVHGALRPSPTPGAGH